MGAFKSMITRACQDGHFSLNFDGYDIWNFIGFMMEIL